MVCAGEFMKSVKQSKKEFLDAIKSIANYWANEGEDKQSACDGVAFSIMALLDGCSSRNLNGYMLMELDDKGHALDDITGELHDDYAKLK